MEENGFKNVVNNSKYLNLLDITEEDYKKIGLSFSKIAKENNMTVQTCFEDINLVEYGFIKRDCLPKELAYIMTGKKIKEQTKTNSTHNFLIILII